MQENKHMTKYIIFTLLGVILFFLGEYKGILGLKAKHETLKMVGSAVTGGGLIPLLEAAIRHIGRIILRMGHSLNYLGKAFIKKDIDAQIAICASYAKHKDIHFPEMIFSDTEGVMTSIDRENSAIDDIVMFRSYLGKLSELGKSKVIINTGRCQGYVEMLCQILGIANNAHYDIPHIIENGAALYNSYNKSVIPLLDKEKVSMLYELDKKLRKHLPDNIFEPKTFLITVNPNDSDHIDKLYKDILDFIHKQQFRGQFEVHYSFTAVDVSIKGVNKLSAVNYIVDKYFNNNSDVLPNSIIVSSHNSDLEIINSSNIGKAYCVSEHVDRSIEKSVMRKSGKEHILSSANGNVLCQVIERECGLSLPK